MYLYSHKSPLTGIMSFDAMMSHDILTSRDTVTSQCHVIPGTHLTPRWAPYIISLRGHHYSCHCNKISWQLNLSWWWEERSATVMLIIEKKKKNTSALVTCVTTRHYSNILYSPEVQFWSVITVQLTQLLDRQPCVSGYFDKDLTVNIVTNFEVYSGRLQTVTG